MVPKMSNVGPFAARFLAELKAYGLRIGDELVEWEITNSNEELMEACAAAELLVAPFDLRVRLDATRVETDGAAVGLTFGDAEFSGHDHTSLEVALRELSRNVTEGRHVLAKVTNGLMAALPQTARPATAGTVQ